VTKDNVWRNGIMNTDSEPLGFKFLNPKPKGDGCNPGGSMCTRVNGTFTCAPPTVQLAGRWDELDLNGDGVWTKREVEQSREQLKCKYAVDPLEVFNVFVKLLVAREDVIWIHPSVRAGHAIHKAYFTYASGDVIMCGYRNEKMCPNLLKRGVFDAPLRDGTSPRVGETINSALDFCHDLLRKGGVCERMLPSAYSSWRTLSEDECGTEQFTDFTYNHPTTGMGKSMLSVDYHARGEYEKGKASELFLVYRFFIILTFVLSMFVELKDIIVMITWVMHFPSEDQFGEEFVKEQRDPANPEKVTGYTIQGISSKHRWIVGIMSLARLVLTFVLTLVGVSFLLQDTDYVNLLMNGVGMVFILEIANCLYGQILHQSLRDQAENTSPMEVKMIGSKFLNERPALKDIVCFGLLVGLLLAGTSYHYSVVVRPLSHALECTCISSGAHCHEAQAFNTAFWTKYWNQDVPDVFDQVEKLKARSVDAGVAENVDASSKKHSSPKHHSKHPAAPIHSSANPQHHHKHHKGHVGLLNHA